MAEEHTGIVTILFTDQVGSTEVLQRLGEDAADAQRRAQFALLRDAVQRYHGEEVKTIGDGVMAVFGSALDALSCAIAMEQAVERYNRLQVEGHALGLRVGLDAGEPIRRQHDYFGKPVVIAKRLCDSADGGQIIASDLVRRLVGTRGGHAFSDLRLLTLKGIEEAVPACTVVWAPADEPAAPVTALTDGGEAAAFTPWFSAGDRTQFVGRAGEIERLRHAWDLAQEGSRQLVLIEGEPGIGKSRLAAEIALRARDDGATVLYGRCDEGATQSYRPFVDVLTHFFAACPPSLRDARLDGRGEPLSGAVPAVARLLSSPAPAAEHASAARALPEALASLLLTACLAAPVVLVLDDVHWAGDADVLLLKSLLRSLEASPLLAVCTYTGSLPAGHAMTTVCSDLRRRHAFSRITLGGMAEGDVGALIAAWSGHESPPAFTQAIRARTDGNPFFIEEALRHLTETGAIYEEGGRVASLLAVEEMGIPDGVREMIGHRLALLSEPCTRVLAAASVIGREFDLATLERASAASAGDVIAAVEEACLAGIVAESPPAEDRYAFRHALIRETLYDGLTAARRAGLHRQTLRYADNDRTKLAYEMLGRAGPALLATGISNCPAVRMRSMPALRMWERLSRSCRVILYDRRGVGSSDVAEHGYSLRASVEDVRAVLDAAGVERALLWGAADGGPLAIQFTLIYPERVTGLILVGTTPRLEVSEDWAHGINPAAMRSFFRLDPVDQVRAAAQLNRVRGLAEAETRAIDEVMRRVPRQAWAKVTGGIYRCDLRDELQHIATPTLIIHDPDNQYVPVAAARYMHERIANSELEITADLSAPLLSDALYGRIERFIDGVTSVKTPAR